MLLKTYIIDAFTNQPFKGNPAGVCVVDVPLDEHTMQSIAAELNHSETAFLLKDYTQADTYHIRYFTPSTEIPFCGHATLASAKLIQHSFKHDHVTFITHHQLEIPVQFELLKIKMKFPIYYPREYKAGEELLKGLGIDYFTDCRYSAELDLVLFEVPDATVVRNLKPDFSTLLKETSGIKLAVVTALSDKKEYDFVSRCFCPWIGINEDPVTGAAHSALSGYWKNRLKKSKLAAHQASKRGGSMLIRIQDDEKIEITGEAVILLEGMLTI